MRDTQPIPDIDGSSSHRSTSTADYRRAVGRLAPGVRGMRNALPLSFLLWAAVLFVCFG